MLRILARKPRADSGGLALLFSHFSVKLRVASFVLVAACGSGGKDRIPSADVVIGDVDGGTVVGPATPSMKKKWPSKTEARPLDYRECQALSMHVIEIIAREANVDPDTMRATYGPNALVECDQPVFSDEIFDCVLAAKSQSELPPCMRYGDLLKH